MGSPVRSTLRMLLLVGVPGSGKSTFSKRLCEESSRWVRVNQDDLGTRRMCEDLCRQSLEGDLCVVIDRCNFDSAQRKVWISIARRFSAGVDVLVFQPSEGECRRRVWNREDHPTGVQGDKGMDVLDKFRTLYAAPNAEEGYDTLTVLGETFWGASQSTVPGEAFWTRERIGLVMNTIASRRALHHPRPEQ